MFSCAVRLCSFFLGGGFGVHLPFFRGGGGWERLRFLAECLCACGAVFLALGGRSVCVSHALMFLAGVFMFLGGVLFWGGGLYRFVGRNLWFWWGGCMVLVGEGRESSLIFRVESIHPIGVESFLNILPFAGSKFQEKISHQSKSFLQFRPSIG